MQHRLEQDVLFQHRVPVHSYTNTVADAEPSRPTAIAADPSADPE